MAVYSIHGSVFVALVICDPRVYLTALYHRSVLWETLGDIDNDTNFVDSNFQPLHGGGGRHSVAPSQGGIVDPDAALARHVQDQLNAASMTPRDQQVAEHWQSQEYTNANSTVPAQSQPRTATGPADVDFFGVVPQAAQAAHASASINQPPSAGTAMSQAMTDEQMARQLYAQDLQAQRAQPAAPAAMSDEEFARMLQQQEQNQQMEEIRAQPVQPKKSNCTIS